MLISATIVRRPRRLRYCSHCERVIVGPTLRLFGAAETGDQPYPLYLHPRCTQWEHPKIAAALAAQPASPIGAPDHG